MKVACLFVIDGDEEWLEGIYANRTLAEADRQRSIREGAGEDSPTDRWYIRIMDVLEGPKPPPEIRL